MTPSPQTSSSKVGAGRSIVNRHERTFNRGTLMFIEGESSAEMFIIRSGKVRILKQEGESTIELAILGAGSVLGELALLDHQPRTATGQVLEDTTVTVIDEELFSSTLQKIPSWLGNLIQLVVKRLRDTMRRTSEDVVRRSVAGVLRVMLLLLQSEGKLVNGLKRVPLGRTKECIYATIGLGGMEAENVFLHLTLKEMIVIKKDDFGQEHIIARNPEAMQLYLNYLRAKQRNLSIVGEEFSDESFELLELILATGERNGKKEGQKLVRVGLPQIEIELERAGRDRHVNFDALDQLVAAKLVLKDEQVTQSEHGHHKRVSLVYNEDTLRKVSLLKVWLPVFREEISF